MGSHAFFIRADLLDTSDLDLPLRSVKKMSHMPDTAGRQFVDVLYDFVPDSTSGGGSSERHDKSGEVGALRREVHDLSRVVQELRSILELRVDRLGSAQGGQHEGAPARILPQDVLQREDTSGAASFYDEVRQRREV